MQREIGAQAMIDWSDHDDENEYDEDVVNDAIYEGSEELLFGLNGIYSVTSLLTSELAQKWATQLACCSLCNNRGNEMPASLEKKCEQIMENLKKIREGNATIPGIAAQGNAIATATNVVIDRRFRDRTVRVRKRSSTGEQGSALGRDFFEDQGEWS